MLRRQPSISEDLVNDMFIDAGKREEIAQCLRNNNRYTNLNPTQTGIYWNDTYNNYHISFHPGGSMSPAGAMHIKYDVRDNYGRLIRTVNFPIHVYDIEQRNNRTFTNPNVMRFGQDIEIDLSRLHQIPSAQQNDVLYLLGQIGDCLFQALSYYLQSRDRLRWSGGKKIRRTRKKEVKKKKKTLKK